MTKFAFRACHARLRAGTQRALRRMHRRLPRARARSGFTLVELLTALTISYILASIAIPQFHAVIDVAKTARAAHELRTINDEIAYYEATSGNLPATLADIGRNTLLDPWGNLYQYLPFPKCPGGGCAPPAGYRQDQFGAPLSTDYDLYSNGIDGASAQSITMGASRDDVIRAADGGYMGVASNY